MNRQTLVASFAVVGAAVGSIVGAPPASAAGSYDITVSIKSINSASPHVGDTLTVSGSVTDATTGDPVSGLPLQIVRTDRNGTQPAFVATTGTGMDAPVGSYSANDPEPAVRGTITYDVSAADGSTGHGSVFVYRLPTTLKITASKSIVRSGNDVRISAHLGTPTTNRTVSIFAKPYDLDRRLIVTHDVDSNGNLSVTPTVHRRTAYIARFAGDDTYAPAHASVVVRAQALVTERLHGGYATVNGVRLYRATGVPVLSAHLFPQLDSVCLWFKAQRHYNGAWHTVAVKCFETDQYGRARAEFRNVELNSPYRVRARYAGSKAASAAAGPWYRLEFR